MAAHCRRRPSSPWIHVEIVAALIVGWNLVVGVLFELGEQYRFRADHGSDHHEHRRRGWSGGSSSTSVNSGVATPELAIR